LHKVLSHFERRRYQGKPPGRRRASFILRDPFMFAISTYPVTLMVGGQSLEKCSNSNFYADAVAQLRTQLTAMAGAHDIAAMTEESAASSFLGDYVDVMRTLGCTFEAVLLFCA
jgi:hypothetical protein